MCQKIMEKHSSLSSVSFYPSTCIIAIILQPDHGVPASSAASFSSDERYSKRRGCKLKKQACVGTLQLEVVGYNSEVESFMKCSHRSSYEKHWLPRTTNGLLAPHPCCESCGFIKNISSEKAKGTGYCMNVLSALKGGKEKLLTYVQIRPIASELQKVEGFDDSYCTSFANQKRTFINAVTKYSNLSSSFVESFL